MNKILENQSLQNRIFGLDLMRAIAILMVLFGHCVWIIPERENLFHQLLVLSGFFGVEIFFVLSGFLIGKILYQLYLKEDFSIQTVFYFLKRRWFRTLPNYFLILLVNLAIASFVGYAALSWWKYFFFIQNLNSTMLPFFPESWSLSVEEFAYITLPFFLLIIGSFIKPKNKSRFFLWSVITLIMVFFFAKFYYHYTTQNTTLTQWNLSLKAVVIYRLDSIFIGVFCSWIYLNYTSLWQKNKLLFFVIGMLLFFFQFVGIGFLGWLIEVTPMLWNVFYLPLISVAVACFLPFLSEWKTEKSRFQIPVTFISLISYSIYLLHYSVILLLMKEYIIIDDQNTIQLVAFLSSYILITIILSYFLYRFYEKPMMNLRDKN
ncbi:acyltransferase [Flavobacterium sp. IMCC34852]|uniref:Acyltransferase n=1 Tax=Flavobacterium rivulicola TaxID=2732161 RepID=A0A7Y3R901_9FLAO|nr:acyltransferase [Flavobacterium sp. IMCC34852]NNT72041.1 acyltransferase [Flavobacterium sp. IMCC34852]